MSNQAIFLDRDDTLIEDSGYINHPDQVKLLDGVPEALIELRELGYKLIVASNQSAVARGIITEKVLAQIHDRLQQLLAEKGASIDRIYYCPYHPEGAVAKYRQESDWRKPKPGMLLAAAKEMDIDLRESWMIGNSDRDIEAGARAGCKTIRIDQPERDKSSEQGTTVTRIKPDYRAVNLREAVNLIKRCRRGIDEGVQETQPPAQIEQPAQTPEAPPAEAPVQQPESETLEQEIAGDRTEQLLSEILQQLRNTQRTEMFGEFSVMRLLAGITQVIVLFCLLMAIWFLTSPARSYNAVFVALSFAAVLQLMSLTFYIMQERK
jgi:D-glycero-D-manno-heptose 1,7-bisphosphate phosphatase